MILRSLLRLFGTPTAPKPITSQPDNIVLYAHLPRMVGESKNDPTPTSKAKKRRSSQIRNSGSHRQHLLSMRLEHIRICSPRRCKRLNEFGIVTAGDLASADPHRLAEQFNAPRKALRTIQHYRRAIRFSASVPGMMPRDALLLVSIHRRSIRGLATESAAQLYRDLQRFAESSQGQALLRGRRLPSTRRLKRWIAQCESMASSPGLRTRAA
ncbi:hypothetical protein Poly51_52190 [Rubripirellula tenax]|uniref:DUF4332 domain-containing protein n=1 Tax=Rubripirellula tenax TaxID=2528015 RepID=A0A5C6EJH0_9BACT|nr:DUF4332 domain-containing protein [Rubripirellula tenax]TWU47419.1 hypothetical protein Poly51_52190 [Rubripirellula tenax]